MLRPMPETPAQPLPWWSAFIAPSDEERAVAAADSDEGAQLDCCSPQQGGDTTPDET